MLGLILMNYHANMGGWKAVSLFFSKFKGNDYFLGNIVYRIHFLFLFSDEPSIIIGRSEPRKHEVTREDGEAEELPLFSRLRGSKAAAFRSLHGREVNDR